MDRVRFGRALGYGARHAARALSEATQAAIAPPSSPPRPPTASAASHPPPQPPASPAASAAPASVSAARLRHAARRSQAGLWSPLARFSSVLWLQVTGTLFAVVAAFLIQGAWSERAVLRSIVAGHAALQATSPPLLRLLAVAAAGALFAYLAISNFVRAARRDRR